MVAVSLALFIYRFAIRSWASVARSLWYSWAIVQIYISFSFGSKKYNVPYEHIFSVTEMISIHGTFSLHNHLHSSTETANEKLSWRNTTLFSFSCPMLDLSCGEHTFSSNRWRAGAEIDLSNFAQDWQWLFVALPEGERLVIEFRRIAHVKIMFYLALRRVSLGRVHLSY